METKLFGLSMKKGKKIRLIIAMVLVVLCFGMYVITGFYQPDEAELVRMPSGNLSSSIYDAQNMNYVEVEGLDVEHTLDNLPFTVDVINAERASVGDADVFLQEPYHFYVRVAHQTDDVVNCLKEDLTSIISFGAESNSTQVEVLAKQNGYINGCAATFYVCELNVEGCESYYLSLYRLHVDKSIYESEYDILLGVMATGYNTQRLQETQALAQASVGTLKFSEKLLKELEKAK